MLNTSIQSNFTKGIQYRSTSTASHHTRLMSKKNLLIVRRVRNVLRLALFWAKKGGEFKQGLKIELQLLPNYIKSLCHQNTTNNLIHYKEREFSFEETPIFDFKMLRTASKRFHMPRLSCLRSKVVEFGLDEDCDKGEESYGCEDYENEMVEVGDGIDIKAEEFIAKFYQQLRLQGQITNLQ